jgi:hypothetical protein
MKASGQLDSNSQYLSSFDQSITIGMRERRSKVGSYHVMIVGMQVTAIAVSSPQRTRGIKNNVPSKLGNLPLLRDVVVLPGLVYYLRNRM